MVQAQKGAEAVPARSEMAGDYIIMNMQEYEGMVGLANMRAMKVSVEGDSLNLSGFYMLQGVDNIKAGYNEQNGNITIPSGTEILRSSNIIRVLYLWDEDAQEVSRRAITYEYIGNGTWATEQLLMIMYGYVGEELSPGAYFAQGSEIHRANAVSENVSYYGTEIESQQRYDESRPSFISIEDGRVAVYNLLQTDQYGYGCVMEGVIGEDGTVVSFAPNAVGQANDGTYKVLAGCGYDEENNIPDGLTNSFFEFVAETKVAFEPDDVLASSVQSSPEWEETAKDVERVEYYRMDGVRVMCPRQGELLVKRMVYTDGTVRSEKMFAR